MKLRFVLLAALLMTLAGTGLASAQGGVTYTSGFQVQNLASTTANVVLDFYNQDGTVAASVSDTIPANGAKTYFPLPGTVPSGFNGSLVISSDQNLRAVNNMLGSGPGSYFDSTTGFSAGATTVNLPLIMCSNGGFDTWYNIQNAGSSDATVNISYTAGGNGVDGSEGPFTIKAGAAKTFSQALGSSTLNCSSLKDAAGKFVGSATVTSNQPVVAAVMQVNTTNFKVLMSYGGFGAGSPSVLLPLVMANNGGMYTGIQVQNVGTASTTVHVTYSANTAGNNTDTPAAESFTLAAGASQTLIQNAGTWATFGKYVGNATVTNDGNQSLVAIVNQVLPTKPLGSSYNGFDPASATNNASVPLIMANNSTYYTGVQVQNTSATASAQVTIHYTANTAGTFAPADEVFTLTPNSSKTVIQNGAAGTNGSVNSWTQKYVGSATITADHPVVAIVNQVSFGVAGDQLGTIDAFNY